MLPGHLSVLHTLSQQEWTSQPDETAVNAAEEGKILFFPHLRFALSAEEMRLISPALSDGKAKNISFNLAMDHLKGAAAKPVDSQIIKNMLKRYSEYSSRLIKALMPSYKKALKIGRTSLRPVEIEGRKTVSHRKDDTRLHIDAFPANPNQGFRILRMFSNIHAQKPRVWHTGESFEKAARRFLPSISQPMPLSKFFLSALRITKSLRTPYDHIMLNLHNRMKEDENYQQTVKYAQIAFPAQTSWMVYTDKVSHAALSGQHVLEQTFYLPVQAMQNENQSPLRILEKMTGRTLV